MNEAEILPRNETRPGRRRRKATHFDHVRVTEFARRVEAGEDEIDAFWAVASDEQYGLSRFRGSTDRPPDFVLRRKLSALLSRAAPATVAAARDQALVRLANLSDDALAAVVEVLTGECADARAARARLDAAKTVLASIGISDRGKITVATQVKVGGGRLTRVPDGA